MTPRAPVGQDVHFPRKRAVWPTLPDSYRFPRQGQLRTPIIYRESRQEESGDAGKGKGDEDDA